MTRLHWSVAALVAVVVLAVASLSEAGAHARYASSTPAQGEVLSTSPAQVEVEFTQDVQKVSGSYGMEVVLQPGGQPPSGDMADGEAELDDANRSVMRIALQPDLSPGRYVVNWHNVSDADGDPFEGTFSFYVGVQPTEADLAADAELAAAQEEETPTPEPIETPATTPDGGATAVPPDVPDDNNGDGDSNATVIIVTVIAVIAGVGLGYLAYRYLVGRRA